MAEGNRLRRAGKTHIGLVRSENQDNLIQFASPFGEVFLVADGMGGARGGATASRMVVEGFQQQLGSLPGTMPAADALRRAARFVAEQVHAVGRNGDPQYAGMGSTVVLAVVSSRTLVVAHIGDSRAYLYRGKKLQRLTRDHTAVQRMVDSGMISEDEARDHPNASVLSRAIGPAAAVEIEVSAPIELQPGDGVLLCSDGLSGYVDDPVIERTLAPFFSNPDEASAALIQLALDAGGEDNVTVQYLHVQAHRPTLRERVVAAPPAVGNRAAGRPLLRNPVVFVAVVLLTALAAFGLGWAFRNRLGLGAKPLGAGSGTSAPVRPAEPARAAPQPATPPDAALPAAGGLPGAASAGGAVGAGVPEPQGATGAGDLKPAETPKKADTKAAEKTRESGGTAAGPKPKTPPKPAETKPAETKPVPAAEPPVKP